MMGIGWWHWIVFNIPPTTTNLLKGAGKNTTLLPKGAIQSVTDFQTVGYGGPCPPVGDKPHHYIFTLYALDVVDLGEKASATPAQISALLSAHTIEKASFTVYYGRK